jgi:hypothetical protein
MQGLIGLVEWVERHVEQVGLRGCWAGAKDVRKKEGFRVWRKEPKCEP